MGDIAVPVLAFDRELALEAISMPASIAEQFSRSYGAGGTGLYAHVRFHILKARVAPKPKHFTEMAAIFNVRLDEVTITDGTSAASIPVSEFETAVAVHDKAKEAEAAAQKAAEENHRILEANRLREQEEQSNKQAAGVKAALDDFMKLGERPAGAFGPDIAGLRLGMTLTEVDLIVRKHMNVKYASRPQPSLFNGDLSDLLKIRRTYANNDLSRIVTISYYNTDRVVMIVSRTKLPNDNITLNDLTAELVKIYGEPTERDSQFGWHKENRKCASPRFFPATGIGYWHMDENSKLVSGTGWVIKDDEILNKALGMTTLELFPELPKDTLKPYPGVGLVTKPPCGETLFATVYGGALLLSLHDQTWLNRLYYEATKL